MKRISPYNVDYYVLVICFTFPEFQDNFSDLPKLKKILAIHIMFYQIKTWVDEFQTPSRELSECLEKQVSRGFIFLLAFIACWWSEICELMTIKEIKNPSATRHYIPRAVRCMFVYIILVRHGHVSSWSRTGTCWKTSLPWWDVCKTSKSGPASK